jgi:hypothetical protein
MNENYERRQNEGIQLNISITRIETASNLSDKKEREKNSLTKENKVVDKDKKPKQPIERQKLKPEDIMFEKLPIQKFFPIQFEKCIESYDRIDRLGRLIFIDLKLEKRWLDYLIERIHFQPKIQDMRSSEPLKSSSQINVHISEIGDKKIYSMYIETNSFRFMFSDQSLYAHIVCGKEYLSNYSEETNAVIPQKEIKKGLLNYIFKKWIN